MQTFTGTTYLKIDIANCFGLDRMSWNARLGWFTGVESKLESLAGQAKSPILYRKAVRAMRAVQQGNPTNHIMGLDATASGLQIMAALSGCHDTAKATNLINTGNRMCVYQAIADSMNALPDVSVTRDEVKKPVMTVFYGSTAKPKEIFGTGATLNAFYTALEENLPGAYDLMGLLQQYWNSYATKHQWTLPDGHIACVPVTQTVEKNIEIDECAHMRFAYRAQVVAPMIRSRSLAANIIHSIDGWIVRQMVSAAHQQGFWLAPIHDCFYTSPNNMDKVRKNYNTIMTWIANSSQVSKILSEIKGSKVTYIPLSHDLGKYITQSEYSLS